MNDHDTTCARCHEDYSLGEGCEPSKYCNRCVHDVVEELEAKQARLVACVQKADAMLEQFICGCGECWRVREPYAQARAAVTDIVP